VARAAATSVDVIIAFESLVRSVIAAFLLLLWHGWQSGAWCGRAVAVYNLSYKLAA